MIQINPDRLVRVTLTPKEQKTVLEYCRDIDDTIYSKIVNAKDGVINLLTDECHILRQSIFLGAEQTNKNKIKDILGHVFNKLTPNPQSRSIIEELSKHDFDNIEEANYKAQEIMDTRNDRPDSEMGGMSPNQVTRLIYLPWDDDNFPLKFNKELKLFELKNSPFFTNTTIFLKTLIEYKNENTATAKGNLNRKIVKILFDRFILDEKQKELTLEFNKVLNETDVFPLHIIRVVCQSAGIINTRKNKFLVPQKYQNLISEEKAGELYHLLFNSYFRKFNIGYLDRLSELECIQHTVAYSIYRLGEIGDSYRSVDKLLSEMLLPSVIKEIREEISPHIKIEWLLERRIIEPLQKFGLVECRYKKEKYGSRIDQVRKTKLFDKYVRCEW